MKNRKFIEIIGLLSVIGSLIFYGCAFNSYQFPHDINIDKNQLIYKDDKMQIWAHDDKGYHHNFTPADSAQYKLVTNHIGSNLNSIFVGRCNYHGVAEVVIVSPEIISIKTRLANNSRSSSRKKNKVPETVNNGTGVQIIQSTPSPARSFQPVQQTTDTKN